MKLPKAPRRRAPIDVTQERQPTDAEFADACDLIDWLGPEFHAALREAIGEGKGRPGSVPARAVLVAWTLNAFQEGSRAEHTDVASQIVACSDTQLAALGMSRLPPHRAYARIWDKTTRIHEALEEGFDFAIKGSKVHVDLDWWCDALAQGSIPADLPRSRTRAVDGTDWETCGTFVQPDAEYDGATPPDTDTPLEEHAKTLAKTRARLKGRVPLGPDGRGIYTNDSGARAGHRSANNQHNAGMYNGYEGHLSVQTRDFTYRGRPGELTFGPEVPNVITALRLTEAGAHRGHAAVPMLLAERVPDAGQRATPDRAGTSLSAVVWDRGYSLLAYENAHGPLWMAGIQPTFDLTTAQREQIQVMVDIDWLDGAPFSKHTPSHLRDLPREGRNDTWDERVRLRSLYDERARWRFSHHGLPDADGFVRLICPFHAGRLRATNLPQGKASKSAPLVTLPDGVDKCCSGIVTAAPEFLKLAQAQALLFQTTAWTMAYGPRVLVETGNSLIKDKYATLNRAYTKLMGLAKRKFALAFLIAGINRRIVRAWRAKQADEPGHRRRLRKFEATRAGLVARSSAEVECSASTNATTTTHRSAPTAPPSRVAKPQRSRPGTRRPRTPSPLRT
ncbi:hypothetical protein [Actinotalea sp. K2]|uniref:hypothetical protein n=1 Tax=Actinotalea sp. K2 TaxID=2939438 RepID=UPI00201774A5|nr:hypothetical protein [Actinotalea sp. K2]